VARLLLVRHGETEWNKFLRYQGQSDIELSPKGIEQVQKLRDRLALERIDIIYSSDLKRALKTASIIASSHSVKVIPLKELREVDFGEFEGLTFEEIEERYPQVVKAGRMWFKESLEARAPKGESISQLASRLSRFAGRLKEHKPEDTVLVVAHGGSLQVLLCILLEIEIKHWWQIHLDSASLSVVKISPPGAVLVLLNDTCHLY
jgi:alpha-ribazole phosphatase